MLTPHTIWERMNGFPSSDFLVTQEERITYGTLTAFISRILALFDACGLASGDRVVITTGDEPVAIGIFIAALLDGLVPVMLTPTTPADRAAAIRDFVDARLVVADQASQAGGCIEVAAAAVAKALPRPQFDDRLSRCASEIAGESLLDLPKQGRAPHLPGTTDELAYVLFTSGTTQAPSGVMVSHGNVLANLHTLSRLFGYDHGSRIHNDMVLAHGDGLVQGPLLAIANGCALIRSGGFSVHGIEAWLGRVRSEHATHVITVPTVWALIERYASRDDYFDGEECRMLLSVAARLDPKLWRQLENRFRRPVYNQYGLTETVASALYAGPHPEMGAFGTIGRPVDCEARISDASSGQQAGGPDEAGELQIRGTNVFPGYWKNEARTATSFSDDGWLRTGDLARRRADGSYEILGRIKTVIMSGGFLIRPEEIDEAMMLHPTVAESVTVGLADPYFEEVPVTAVVLDGTATEAELTAHARARLEPLKVPKRIIELPAIPRGDAGKPKLDALRASLSTTLAEGTSNRRLERVAAVVYSLAGEVFRVDPATLGPGSSTSTVPGWDSYSQIALIMAVEERFAMRIPVSDALNIRKLGDLTAMIAKGTA